MGIYVESMFSRKLKSLMDYRGVTQEGLAKALDMSQGTVSNWATGKGFPKLKFLPGIARELRATISYLVDDEDTRTLEEFEVEMDVRKAADVIGWDGIYRAIVDRQAAAGPGSKDITGTILERPQNVGHFNNGGAAGTKSRGA